MRTMFLHKIKRKFGAKSTTFNATCAKGHTTTTLGNKNSCGQFRAIEKLSCFLFNSSPLQIKNNLPRVYGNDQQEVMVDCSLP